MASRHRLSNFRSLDRALILAALGTLWLAGCRPAVQGGAPVADAVTIAYDGNGSCYGWTPLAPASCRAGQRVAAPDNPGGLYRPGWVFRGWNTRPDGTGAPLQEGDGFTPAPAGVVLYAQWGAWPSYPALFRNPGGELR